VLYGTGQAEDRNVRCCGSGSSAVSSVYLNLEREVFLEVLDDHDEERELDAKRRLGLRRASNIACAYVRACGQ
jgi:hypothetical protein